MRTIFYFIPVLLTTFSFSQSLLESTITDVTVFLSGAQIHRKASVDLQAGRNTIVLTNLTKKLVDNSVQVQFDKDVSVLSISTRKNTVDDKLSESITKNLDTLDAIEKSIDRLRDTKYALEEEKKMILANQSIGGHESYKSDELLLISKFFNTRLLEIKTAITELDYEKKDLSYSKQRLEQKLRLLNHKSTRTEINEIVMILDSKEAVNTTMEVQYITPSAAWLPEYEIHAHDLQDEIQLNYKAKIKNNTGYDWDEVNMELSTANPTLSASKPHLSTWTLNYNRRNSYNEGYLNTNVEAPPVWDLNPTYMDEKKPKVREIEIPEFLIKFPIEEKASIPGNNITYHLLIKEHMIKAQMSYLAIPKVDRDAFLIAKITDWEDLNLLDGEASIYFEDKYVGKSKIETRNVSDTLELSLGRDNKVLVTRIKKKDLNSKKLIGFNRKESFIYEITVKNNRSKRIELELKDQVPISQESDIEITVENISNAQRDPANGALDWTTSLNPGESKTYTVAFTVKYPRNRSVKIRKGRNIYAPSYF